MAKLIKCKTCGTEISNKALTCPSCGEKLKKYHPILTLFLSVIIIVSVAGTIGSGGYKTSSTTSAQGAAKGSQSLEQQYVPIGIHD